jgi:hypothetical protein
MTPSKIVGFEQASRRQSEEHSPPANRDAERSIVGAILLQSELYVVAANIVTDADFFDPRHQHIFRAMRHLAARGQIIDYGLVVEELDRSRKLDDAGGRAYVASLTDGVPRSVNIAHYASIVHRRARERTAMYECQHAAAALANAPDESGEIIARLRRAIAPDVLDAAGSTNYFVAIGEGRYALALIEAGVRFEIDRLRRERHELVGELVVQCEIAGARTVDGALSIDDFNLSSARARQDRARLLADRAKAPDLDWLGALEEFCQRVLAAERAGQPAVVLRDLEKAPPAEEFDVDGVRLLKRHPAIIFGDGGDAKSMIALYIAGQLERRGVRVLYCDWEFAGEEHRDRLERLFGADMPAVRYLRCERPLVHEADRLRRIVREEAVDYLVLDSIAFACDGPPEAAEVAGAYYRALRGIGVGSLHIAHTSKGDNADQKPFGSTFWHNGARATWYVKRGSTAADGQQISVGLFNRKSNIGPLRPAAAFEIAFETERTWLRRVDVTSVDELAANLPLRQRIVPLLRDGARTIAEIAEELGEKTDSIEKTLKRSRAFARVEGQDRIVRWGLAEGRVAS